MPWPILPPARFIATRPTRSTVRIRLSKWFLPLFALVLVCGLGYVAYALGRDLTTAVAVPWILLGLALLIALGFEFVNGFHDTANAVATVIYTRSMPRNSPSSGPAFSTSSAC